MNNNIKMKRLPYNWEQVEKKLGFKIYENYKDFYETCGAISIDDYIYIINPTEEEFSEDLYNFGQETINEMYPRLEEYLDEEFKIKFYDGDSGWLPIGYTTNGDYIFCTEDSVIITDAGFERREIYECTLIDFVNKYLTENLDYEVLTDGREGEKHEIMIIYKNTSRG